MSALKELLSLSDKSTPRLLHGPAVWIHQEPQGQKEPEAAAAQHDPLPKKRKSLASFIEKKSVGLSSMTEEDRIKTELTTYLLTPELEDADSLQWWRQHEDSFPRLSKLAKKHL